MLEAEPLFKPIILSATSKFVWLTVVVVPLTVKSPDILALPFMSSEAASTSPSNVA